MLRPRCREINEIFIPEFRINLSAMEEIRKKAEAGLVTGPRITGLVQAGVNALLLHLRPQVSMPLPQLMRLEEEMDGPATERMTDPAIWTHVASGLLEVGRDLKP